MEKHRAILNKTHKNNKRKLETNNEEDGEEELSTEQVTCEENHIYFYDDVDSKSILLLIRHIKNINIKLATLKAELDIKYKANVKFAIYLHINSSGGYITDAFAAIDYIKSSKVPIISIVEGYAASAATFLSIVCSERHITKMSMMLIHQLSSEANGTFEQLEDDHENNGCLTDCIKKLYINNTKGKLPSKTLDKILKRDLMWNATKCLQYGLVDKII